MRLKYFLLLLLFPLACLPVSGAADPQELDMDEWDEDTIEITETE